MNLLVIKIMFSLLQQYFCICLAELFSVKFKENLWGCSGEELLKHARPNLTALHKSNHFKCKIILNDFNKLFDVLNCFLLNARVLVFKHRITRNQLLNHFYIL